MRYRKILFTFAFIFWFSLYQGAMVKSEQQVSEKFFKITSSELGRGYTLRLLLVPDFQSMGGCKGFLKLLPRILELHPGAIFINASDLFDAKGDDELKAALRSLNPNILCAAMFDRLAQDKIDPAIGTKGFVDPKDGRIRIGFIKVPEDFSTSSSARPKSDNRSDLMTCNQAHINVAWTTPLCCNTPTFGYFLQKSVYEKILQKDGIKYLAAMPSKYRQAEIIVIDTNLASRPMPRVR